MAAKGWKGFKRSVRATVLVAGARLLMRVPYAIAVAVGGALGRAAWWLSPGLRRDMRASLAIAFPEKTPAERDVIGRDAMRHLGWVTGEIISMGRWKDRMDERIHASPEAVAAVQRAWDRKQGIIFVLGHIGNWELTNRLSRYVQPNAAIAKRSWHEKIDRVMEEFRAEYGVQTFWRDDAATGRKMLKLFKQNGALGILIDQDIPTVQSVFVPFFGRLAATPRAAADFAIRFGATLLVVTCHRRGPRPQDGHQLEVTEVPHDPAPADSEAEVLRVTAACAKVQEDAIRLHPEEWVWMHQRWRSQPPG